MDFDGTEIKEFCDVLKARLAWNATMTSIRTRPHYSWALLLPQYFFVLTKPLFACYTNVSAAELREMFGSLN